MTTTINKLKEIHKFFPPMQLEIILENLSIEESGYYKNVISQLYKSINTAPNLYETDGKGTKVKPVLHYFFGNIDIFVTEIDKENQEHFGYTSLGMGYLEAGYIDLKDIFQQVPLLNLDFNFKPKQIQEYKKIFEEQ